MTLTIIHCTRSIAFLYAVKKKSRARLKTRQPGVQSTSRVRLWRSQSHSTVNPNPADIHECMSACVHDRATVCICMRHSSWDVHAYLTAETRYYEAIHDPMYTVSLLQRSILKRTFLEQEGILQLDHSSWQPTKPFLVVDPSVSVSVSLWQPHLKGGGQLTVGDDAAKVGIVAVVGADDDSVCTR